MHTKYLGTDSYFLGSLLLYLVEHKMPESAAQNMQRLWREIRAAYAELGIRKWFSCITLRMVKPAQGQLPHLKGKAAEIKSLIPALLHVCDQGETVSC